MDILVLRPRRTPRLIGRETLHTCVCVSSQWIGARFSFRGWRHNTTTFWRRVWFQAFRLTFIAMYNSIGLERKTVLIQY
ncbi:hypothetical protein SORBI_3010G214150 [Sorghum bicolor]|uniref:Uncharacterized protein n=1 Tax=Sorghum bicolor TaxID=4558 RepID=A0A1W0VU67_SORBI|nr:hypothetical protein SORBI_3010G214150 [Sorghum bicolor]